MFVTAGTDISQVVRKVFLEVSNTTKKNTPVTWEYWDNNDLNLRRKKVPKYTNTHRALEQVESVNRFNLYEKKLAFTIKATRPTFFGHKPYLKVQVCNLSAIKNIAGVDQDSLSNGDDYEVWFEYCHKDCVSDILLKIQSSLNGLKI